MPEYMNFSGNPAAQIWKLVMDPIHKDLPTKSFPTPTIGSPTGIFGNFSGQSQDTGGDADDGANNKPNDGFHACPPFNFGRVLWVS